MKVSVCMITYNHAKFIAQAIDSVLMQRTDFEYELVIGEDESTDDTRQVVLSYHSRYPGIIRPLLSEQNVGITRNFARTLGSCSGEYIALLDGDDYWTSPHKLQRQADFLDSDPGCALCFHPVRIHRDGQPGQPADVLTRTDRGRLSFDDLLTGNGIQTASVMLRAALIGALPAWYYGLPMEDWPVYLLLAQRGYICHLPEVMAAYRKHAASAWASTSVATRARDSIVLLETIATHLVLDARRTTILRRAISQYHLQIAVDHFGRGDGAAARVEVARATAAYPHLFAREDLLATAIMLVRSGHPPPVNSLFIRAFFAQVLPRMRHIGRLQSKLIAQTYMNEVFEALRDKDSARVDAHLWQGVRQDPSWLTNRGVLTTAARALLRGARGRLRAQTSLP